jgi:uncharacterized protein (TIGR03083 family)
LTEANDSAQVAVEYHALRGRVTKLIRTRDETELEAIAPATPAWRVRDVLAHMVGIVDDALNQNWEGAPGPQWTSAQVDKRRDRSVDDMLAEWDRNAPLFEAGMAEMPFGMTGQGLYDAVTHEHDIRHALGAPGAREVPAVALAMAWVVDIRTSVHAPAIQFDMGDTVAIAGTGDVVATIGASQFELIRAMTGRRTDLEISALDWGTGTPDATLLVGDGSLFRVRAESLNE